MSCDLVETFGHSMSCSFGGMSVPSSGYKSIGPIETVECRTENKRNHLGFELTNDMKCANAAA